MFGPQVDFRRIYPGLFKSKDQLPDDLKAHVRYPKDIFDTQMRIYAKYHQTDTRVFYQQEIARRFPCQRFTAPGLLPLPRFRKGETL